MSINDDKVLAGDEREGKKFAATRLSIKEARVMADDTQLEDAKDIIVKAQSSLDDEEFNLPEDEDDKHNEMKSDLKRLLTLMRTKVTYEKEGRDFALSLETSLDPRRLSARGNEGLSSGTGKTKMRIIKKREAPLEQSKFNVMLELTSNETPGLDLVTVLDISGSMRGEKLEKMKSAMQLVINKLSPIDRLSVVTFSSHSNTLCPLRHMTTEDSKAEIESKVNDLVAGGGTNISAGLKKGLQELKDCSRGWVAIMLLCDGEQGPRDPDAAKVEIGNVPVYTFGLGSYYDPEVLEAIANKSSGGKFKDVQNVDKLSEAFSQCLDGLLRLVVKDLKVTITQKNKTKIEKATAENYSPYRNSDGSVTLPLDDLYEKELRKVIVDLFLPDVSSTKCDDILGISYTYSFRGELIKTKPQFVTITRRNSTPMINEARVVTDKQLKVADEMIIEAQKLLKNVVDETTLKSEVQQLKSLMNSQKIYDQQESEEVTIAETIGGLESHSTASSFGQASAGHSNEVENLPIEFLLDRTQIRKTIRKSLKWSEYLVWSAAAKTYLEKLKVWKVIKPEESPRETNESIENDGETSLATRKAIEELRQFRENWMALIVINEACGIPIKLQIMYLDCARTAWDTLDTNSKQGVNVEKLFEAVQHCDWKKVEGLLDKNHKLATAIIPSSQNTVLHLASLAGEVNIVKKLVKLMEKKDLEIKDKDGYTALTNASTNGDKRIAQCLVQRNKRLVSIPTDTKLLPVVMAMMYGNKEMASYLYKVTPRKYLTNEDNKGNMNGATLLTYSIRNQFYEISFDLIKVCPSLAVALDHYGQSALYQLACMPFAFRSGSQLKFWQRLMYICEPVRDIDWDINETRQDEVSKTEGVPVQDINEDINEMRLSVQNEIAKTEGVPVQDINEDINETRLSVPDKIPKTEGVPIENINEDINMTRLSDPNEIPKTEGAPVQDINEDINETRLSVPNEIPKTEGVPVQEINEDINETRLSVPHEIPKTEGVPVQYINGEFNETRISVLEEVPKTEDINGDINKMRLSVADEDVSQSNLWNNTGCRGIWQRIASRLLVVLGIKRICEMKLVHRRSLQLLHRICEHIKDDLDEDEVVNGIINALHEAAAKGVVELIAEVLEKLPELRKFRDKQGSTIFMKAVEFRQEGVFSLLQRFASKDKMIDWVDDSGENILHKLKYHSVDKITNIQGAVLKMQKELQWLEEIKPMMSRDSLEKQNSGRNTPRQLFSESHSDLVKKAETWMYKTANSCIIVGVLVVTIMFAAAFTVPGGNDQRTGLPLFLHKKLFKIFSISDAVSLFSSTTSVLIFLGILSSRYAEKDFLKALPRKMIFGLFTLFLSIATMMTSFTTTLVMMLHGESRIVIPAIIIWLAAFPLMLFVVFLFPLLFELIMSTYGPSIFHKKSKWLFFSE